MFQVNGIYRFWRNAQEAALADAFGGGKKRKPFARSFREYVAPSGERMPKILVEERGFSKDAKESGYYRVLEMVGEKEVLNRMGAIERYDVEMRVEQVSDDFWAHYLDAEWFFARLKEMGFYVAQREVAEGYGTCIRRFAVHTGKGIIAQWRSSQDDSPVNPDHEVMFLFPERQLALSVVECGRNYLRHPWEGIPPIEIPDTLPEYVTLTDIGPNVFDMIQAREERKDWPSGDARFKMPFVKSDMEQIAVAFGTSHSDMDNTWYYTQGEYKAYFEKCRNVFCELPAEIQKFLIRCTEVEKRYLKGRPWERFRNECNVGAVDDDAGALARIHVFGLGEEGMECADFLREQMQDVSDVRLVVVPIDLDEQKTLADESEEILSKTSGAGASLYCGSRNYLDLRRQVQGADISLIIASTGDSTSWKAASVVARASSVARVYSILLTIPSHLFVEGEDARCPHRLAFWEMYQRAWSVVSLPHETSGQAIHPALSDTKQTILQAAKTIRDLCSDEGWHSTPQDLTNWADAKGLLSSPEQYDPGNFLFFGMGEGAGEHATANAMENALHSQFLKGRMEDATGVLALVETSADMGTGLPPDIQEALDCLRASIPEEAEMIAHASMDSSLGDKVRVCLIARLPGDEEMLFSRQEIAEEQARQEQFYRQYDSND